ncbi:hypothetical protein [Rhodovulum sp. P5]|uniref:hypothetical protein n=1 Tax=Rhodovulum sp. P5 TaxID=1564506 RepID=UPI0015601AEC|nr:hypothetical protein [Rhodovulum sp. P5]
MTDTSAKAGGEAAAWAVLQEAEEHYRRAIRALHEIIEEIEEGKSDRARMLRGALSDLSKASQTAFEERLRVEKKLNAESGGAASYTLDLAAARAEIGSRLDRLRSTRLSDLLPERSG